MKCIWQMDGDKVKGFKCEFSPIDMLMIVSGLKYIVADIERHPKDRERAQHIYDKIMLSRYEDKPQGDDIIVRSNLYPFRIVEADHKTEPTISKMEQVDKDINVRSKDEPQTEYPRCAINGTPFDECGFCEHFNCDTCRCEAQTERSE